MDTCPDSSDKALWTSQVAGACDPKTGLLGAAMSAATSATWLWLPWRRVHWRLAACRSWCWQPPQMPGWLCSTLMHSSTGEAMPGLVDRHYSH